MAGIRRTWDKALYEQKAKDRLERGDDYVNPADEKPGNRATKALRQEFQAADAEAAGPMGSERAFLKSREKRLNLDEKAGKIEVINPTDIEGKKAGFWCEVCSCLLKDSASYLDHVNGKKHQRALGFSMRVERANVDDVKERMQRLKSRVASKSGTSEEIPQRAAIEEYNERLAAQEKEKESLKRKRKEEAEIKKKQRLEEQEADQDSEPEGDDEMAQMMGFKGFGSSKR